MHLACTKGRIVFNEELVRMATTMPHSTWKQAEMDGQGDKSYGEI